MKKLMLVYGAISGGVIIGTMILGHALGGAEGASSSMWFGYLVMIIALSAIFVAMKRYRDRDLGGVIRFGTAFLLGLGITGVAGVVYVGGWEVYLFLTDHAFIGEYTAGIIATEEAAGLSGPELQDLVSKMDKFVEQYANPLFRLPMTFLEIFPVGLLVSLVSAAVLRKSEVLPAGGDEPSASTT